MPFALVFIGLMMIVSGARNTHVQLGEQITKDFTGPGNFTTWIVALGLLGAIGYNEKARPLSHAFMALIIIAMVLANKGFFQKLSEALASGPVAPKSPAENKAQGAGDVLGGSVLEKYFGYDPKTGTTGYQPKPGESGIDLGPVKLFGFSRSMYCLFADCGKSDRPN